MENSRVNITIPKQMYSSVMRLVNLGYYNSFSEAVRTGLRDEVLKYQVPMARLTESELREIDEGFADIKAGRTKSAAELAKELGYEL
ncbi:MAG: type II toxin-antitoxin system ParD family antitoxin [Candidatus Altiarchaeota archaeon]|nr:type II toxin-antitoxin system ParD family antitoxin [Candidatus Altiarchaeota archaeon]